ncbi:MAG: hypothetical protein HF314_04320 [Ignavibacteria bacterium]|jgi:cyclophilin family peptidyl-prolyl cis-trans isomerase/HEAT repeat protein|nr:hypothetical protein [Ignavibacteria bacterium]MCU7502275.1 hypothetical protein [Ignavibacteria bacterium]MCU7516681.1 hypothetical protein [Ignavibacteria bacterium]
MLKKLFILFLISSPLFSQYTPADIDLAETTYSRTFKPEVINKYLSSGRTENVKAALLSLSNSSDTSFIKTITGLSFYKYGSYISFALSALGPSEASASYLLKKVLDGKEGRFREAAFDALGKTGGIKALNTLLEKYGEGSDEFEGISLAIAGFNSRGIKSKAGKELSILNDEVSDKELPLKRRIQAAFAISRGMPSKATEEILLKILSEKGQKEDNIILRQYALSALRKLKSFHGSLALEKSLLGDPDWRIRCEAAKVLCYCNFKNEEELSAYLQLLKDKNPNVSRQAAISLREASLDNALKDILKRELTKALEEDFTGNTLGEIYLTLSRLEPADAFNIYEKKQDKLEKGFFYRMMEENFTAPEKNFKLLEESTPGTKAEELEKLNALISLQPYLKGTSMLDSILLGSLSSGFAAAVSITADGVDSMFISRHQDELKRIIKRQTDIHLNDPQFTESNFSLAGLAGKISPEFRAEVLNYMKRATLYSTNSFAYRELGKVTKPGKDINNFAEFWENAFRYKFATVSTRKGSFTIKLNPEMSPVSVGSFCSLAKNGFFNGIIFHRVVPNFVIQAGDPEGTGWGGPGYEIISEVSPTPFDRSYVGMASAGKDTEGSQWFIMHSSFPHLNGRYSNFGKVVEGMDTVDTIDQGDQIIAIELK